MHHSAFFQVLHDMCSKRIAILAWFRILGEVIYSLLSRCSTTRPLCSSRLPRRRDELERLSYSYLVLNVIAPGPGVYIVLLREITPAPVSWRQGDISLFGISFAGRACRLTPG